MLSAHFSLGEIHSYQGNMDKAIEQYEDAYQMAVSDVPRAVPQMEETLGIAYLHRSEMENDVFRVPGERCLLPMRAGNGYAKTGDSEKAAEHFLKYLAQRPNELEVRWLLNVTYMTLGGYPEKVPQEYLVPGSASRLCICRRCRTLPRCRSANRTGLLLVGRWSHRGRFRKQRTLRCSDVELG